MTHREEFSVFASRDYLGLVVRRAWITWATQQPNPKSDLLIPYDLLSEADKEGDRQIGEAVASVIAAEYRFRESMRVANNKKSVFWYGAMIYYVGITAFCFGVLVLVSRG